MQVTETEMIIPLIDPLKKQNARLLPIVVGTLGLIGCFLLVYIFPTPFKTFDGNLILNTGERILATMAITLTILAMLLSALFITLQVYRLRIPHHIRINQDGVFYSYYLSVFVKWDEITALVPHKGNNTEGGSFVLSIVLRDEALVIARFLETNSNHMWQRVLYSFLVKVSLRFSHTSNAPSLLYFHQSVLPISIDELITAIQEHFATKLREYHVAIRAE